MKVRSIITLFLGLIVPFGAAVGAQAESPCIFPGADHTCQDPRGRWAIEWREASGGGRHVLWLKSLVSGGARKLLEFDRSVELLWSPSGKALAVTDRAGSNDSVLRVFSGPTLMRAVNVEGRLRASVGRVPEIFDNGHRYFEAVGWVATDVLQFRVRAYDNAPGREYVNTFRYELAGRVSREPNK